MQALFWSCIFLIVYSYFLYPVFLFLLTLAWPKRAQPKNPTAWPRLSLIVAAYNEEKSIAQKIQNFQNFDYPADRLEFILVSDGSNDRTNAIVKAATESDARIKLIELVRSGKAAAINAAVKASNSELLIFSDANTFIEPSALKFLAAHFEDKRVGCVSGRLVYSNPAQVISGTGESMYWRYETALKKMESKLGFVAGANGALYSIRKALFSDLPAGTINDDFMISMRTIEQGHLSLFEENAIAREEVAPDVSGEFMRHIRDGAGHYRAVTKLTKLLNPALGLPAFIYWSHRLLRWAVPFLLILAFYLNTKLLEQNEYLLLFTLQFLFYCLALFGLLMTSKKLPFYIYVPFYFCNLNLALLLGFFKSLLGLQPAYWQRTQR